MPLAVPARVQNSSPNSVLCWKKPTKPAFWLELMQDAGIFPEEKLGAIVQEVKELVAIFVASVRKAKGLTSSI